MLLLAFEIGGGEHPLMKDIHVTNLSETVTESELAEAFGVHGRVRGVHIVRGSAVFAFIHMATSEDAARAVAKMNGQLLGGRKIVLRFARPRVEQRNRSNVSRAMN